MPLTSEDVAKLVFPYIKECVSEAKDISFVVKALSRPFWFKLTRIGIDIAVAITKPKVEPILEYLLQILPLIPEKYLVGIDKQFLLSFLELLKTPKARMHPAVQNHFPELDAITQRPTMSPEDLAELVRRIQYE